MNIVIFGKVGCARCSTTKDKVNHLVTKLGMKDQVGIQFMDMDTVDGLAEGSYYDVFNIPVTIVSRQGQQLARWDGVVPKSDELRLSLEGQSGAAAG